MPRKKKLKLTEYEKALLEYPPTMTTWICQKRKTAEGVVIKHVNTGSNKKCTYCGEARPAKPKLIWPDYVSACEKVGIEPGYQWKLISNVPMMRLKAEGWKNAPPV